MAALRLAPESFDAQISMALAAQDQGDWKAALKRFRQAARLDPRRASVYLLTGNALARLGRWVEAVENYQIAIRINPRYADAFNNLGIALLETGDDREAVAAFARAIEINAHHANAYFNFGKVLARRNQIEIAFELFEKTLAIDARHAYAHLESGVLYEKIGQIEKAADSYRRSMELDPTRTVRENLAAVLTLLGDPRGIERLEELVREQPLEAESHWNLGMGLLLHGRYEQGWREFEWRTEIPRFRKQHHRFDRPRWQGEPLNGKTILLYGEQGHGDTLQFLRYLPLVAGRGGRIILEVPPLLCGLLKQFPGVEGCYALGDARPDFSTYASLMSLPHLVSPRAIPPPIPIPLPVQVPIYLPVQEPVKANSRQPGPLQVGLAWAGSSGYKRNRLKSIPLAQWNSLAQIEGVAYTALQMGPLCAEAGNEGHQFHFVEDCADLPDFAALAALVSKLDLIITVDTAVAHLAGTMGKPVWILLCNAVDWRWGLAGTATDWYPTGRLFRQTTPADWTEVMSNVSSELRKLAAQAAAGETGIGVPCR